MVTIDPAEPIDKALRRFKKECQKAGVMSECRRREFFEKPSDRRRREAAAAKRKERRKMLKMMRKLDRF